MRPADVLGLAGLALIWGTNFLLVEWALSGLNPVQIVLARLVLAGLALISVAWARGMALPGRAGVWGRLVIMGLIGQAIPWLLFAWGQERVSSALAGVYTGATPLLTIPLAWALLRKRPTSAELAASGLGFVGLLVVLEPWAGLRSASPVGQLLCFAGAACYALAFTYASHLMATVRESKLALAAAQAIAASAIMAPVTGVGLVQPPRLGAQVLVAVLLLGAGTAIAFLVNYWLIARLGPVQASLAFYLIPVLAIATGVLVLDERLAPNQAAGSALVVVALALLYAWERLNAKRQPSRHRSRDGDGSGWPPPPRTSPATPESTGRA